MPIACYKLVHTLDCCVMDVFNKDVMQDETVVVYVSAGLM